MFYLRTCTGFWEKPAKSPSEQRILSCLGDGFGSLHSDWLKHIRHMFPPQTSVTPQVAANHRTDDRTQKAQGPFRTVVLLFFIFFQELIWTITQTGLIHTEMAFFFLFSFYFLMKYPRNHTLNYWQIIMCQTDKLSAVATFYRQWIYLVMWPFAAFLSNSSQHHDIRVFWVQLTTTYVHDILQHFLFIAAIACLFCHSVVRSLHTFRIFFNT